MLIIPCQEWSNSLEKVPVLLSVPSVVLCLPYGTHVVGVPQEMSVKYWPSTKEEPSVYGGYQVVLSEEEKDRGDYITRRFKLSPVDNV